jgi:PAS domain S-box-containing protein/putative nucleotidyltransferase with HDIG domain
MTVAVLLAVDDRPDNLFVLERLLAAYLPEIKMITAERAEAGLALAATEAIDGALIDVQMPGMNGFEMCRRLKADPRTAPIHVILVTGHGATAALKAQGLKAGADDFIAKPIDTVTLAAKLRVMLRLRAAEDALRRERDHLEEMVRERTQELQDAEYRYRTLFQTAGDAIVISDLEGRVLEVNEEACRLLGYTRDELLHLTVHDVAAPEYVARRAEILEQLRATGHLVFETELVARDGRIIPTECSSRLMDLQGRPAVLSIARDISERKQAEAAIRESEEKFRNLFNNSGVAMFRSRLDGSETLDMNEKFLEIVGRTRAETQGTPSVIFWEEPKERDEMVRRLVANGRVSELEFRMLNKQGGVRNCITSLVLNREQGILEGTIIDITERRWAEEALKQSLARTTEVQDGTIQALAAVTEVRDPYTAGHQRRVTRLACAVARELGLPADRVAGLRVMGLLHDMGKVSIPTEILSKPGKLSDSEFAIIKSHAQAGYEIVKEIQFPWPVAEAVLQHHERMDGSGYPQRLTGPDITLEARILAVADVVEAMSSHRPYRPALGLDQALEEIAQQKGVLYDPEVVDACIKVCTEDNFTLK